MLHLDVPVHKLMNKYQTLRSVYDAIKADEQATGRVEKPISYPSCWPILVELFGRKSGMGNRDYGQSETVQPNEGEESDDDVKQPEVAQLSKAAKPTNNKRRNIDMAEAVVQMGDAIDVPSSMCLLAEYGTSFTMIGSFALMQRLTAAKSSGGISHEWDSRCPQ